MGRRAEGWRLTFDERSGIYGVRWTRDGVRHHESTRQRDPGAAGKEAESIYAKAVSRRQRVGVGRGSSKAKISVIGSEWIADLDGAIDQQTIDKYDQYVDAWSGFFVTVAGLTGPSIEDFWRARLREVKRKTVMKQLYALNGFLGWLKAAGALEELPSYSMPPKTSTGTPGREQIETVPLSEAEVDLILAALPEWSEKARRYGTKWRVRDRLTVAWETALRPATLDAIEAPRDFSRGTATLRIRDEDDKARFGREVPLSAAARAALDRSAPDVGSIFGPVESHNATDYLRAAAADAGLPLEKATKVKPYDLRHARLTLLAESGNLVGVAFLAGHKAITTTNRYVHGHAAAAAAVLAGAAKGTDTGREKGAKGTGRKGRGR